MAGLRRLLLQLLHAFRPDRAEAELAREVAAHLALLEDEYRRRGMTPDEARRAARRAIGGAEQAKIQHRDARSFRWLDEIAGDAREARRAMQRHWRSSLVAILILTIVGSVNAAILGIADGVLFRRLPYSSPERLRIIMMQGESTGGRYTLVPVDTLTLLEQPQPEFSRAGLIDDGPRIRVITPDGPVGLVTASATASYFEVLGVRPARGRLFSDDDVGRGTHVTLLTYGTWLARFGGREDVVGQSVQLGDVTLDVVGVLPDGLFLPMMFGTRPEIVTATAFPRQGDRGGAFYPVARLADDVTSEQAQARLTAIARAAPMSGATRAGLPVFDPVKSIMFPNGRPIMRWLIAATIALLVLACVNLASLMLVRSHGRSREVGVRLALGASRTRVIRPVLIEVVALSLAGGVLAVVLAKVIFPLLLAQVPRLAYGNAPVGVDLRVSLITVGACMSAALIFTFVPAWRAARRDAQSLIRAGTSQGTAPGWKLGRPLVVLQVALAVVLVFGAVITGRAFVGLLQIPLGFDTENVATLVVTPPEGGYAQDFFPRALDTIRQRPDVIAAGAIGSHPFDGAAPDEGVRTASGQPAVGIAHALPGYFEAVRIPVVRGRPLALTDLRENPNAAVLSESAARVLFPDRDPLGATLDNGRGRTFNVVGVVADVRKNLGSEQEPVVFAMPAPFRRILTFVVRTTHRDDVLLRDLQRSLREIAPASRVTAEWWADSIANVSEYRNPRFQTIVLGTLSAVALILTAFGLVGVVGFLVVARERELGIRAAIGATPGSLVRLVIGQSLVPVGVGVAIGLMATRWASRLAEAQLFDVDTKGAATLAITAGVIVITAIAAAWLPSRRAGRVDPVIILRAD